MSERHIEAKARRIVSMLQGTMALEGMGLGREFLEEMYRKTVEDLREAARREEEKEEPS